MCIRDSRCWDRMKYQIRTLLVNAFRVQKDCNLIPCADQTTAMYFWGSSGSGPHTNQGARRPVNFLSVCLNLCFLYCREWQSELYSNFSIHPNSSFFDQDRGNVPKYSAENNDLKQLWPEQDFLSDLQNSFHTFTLFGERETKVVNSGISSLITSSKSSSRVVCADCRVGPSCWKRRGKKSVNSFLDKLLRSGQFEEMYGLQSFAHLRLRVSSTPNRHLSLIHI